MSRSFVALTLMALAGCGAVTPAGLIAAARLDPLNTDPGALAAAFEVPDTLRLEDGDATLRLSFVDDAGRMVVDEVAPLEIVAGASGLSASDGARFYTARIPSGARAGLAAAQSDIRARRADGENGTGSLSVNVTGGCLTAPLEAGLPVRTYLATGSDRFVPLTARRNLFEALDAARSTALRDRLRSCVSR